jgi:hypothetical protein
MAIPGGAAGVRVHAVPVTLNIQQARGIAARQDIRITMRAHATRVPRGIINMTRAPVTAARRGTRITMRANATRVPKGIINMTRAPVTAARQDIRITMMGNATRSPRVPSPLVLTQEARLPCRWTAAPAARPNVTCSAPDG